MERYCKEHGYTAFRHYDEDDGYSGTNFNRPGFQRMLADIKEGKIKSVVVKDMSRFGRDYLQVGMYTDVLFPDFGVHFIAVNDGVDSTRGENEFTAIRNVFNEMYARDTSKKILRNDPENWAIFENTQPPIIEESVFLIVQNIRKSRRRPTRMGDMGMFSGLLFCADCGNKMYQCRTHEKPGNAYFLCATYRKDSSLCTTHSIRNVILHEIVLNNLREAIQYVTEHEAEFIQEAADHSLRDRDAEFARKREAYAKAEQRIAELDRIISRLYEDNVMGKLSDERFVKMSHDYELEQSNLKAMADVLRKELKQQEQQKTNVKAFIAVVKKYTDMRELDATLLREFIDRIEVSQVDRATKRQSITIVYNFIGVFDFSRAIEEARNTTKKQQRTA